MKKIPTLFLRDFAKNPKYVTTKVNPEAQWVIAGEGLATRKYDGTCCAIINSIFFKRYELRRGKPAPFGFVPADETDPATGKTPGWVEVGNGPEDKWHREAFDRLQDKSDGTFELCGPKVQGNPEGFIGQHILIRHAEADRYMDAPREFNALREWLLARPALEGLVWHHPDGRMAKIKRKDFEG